MAKKPRLIRDVYAEALIREQDERRVQEWLGRFQGLPDHEKVWVMVQLLREARASKDSVDVVREVVRRGHLVDTLQYARLRMMRMGELSMSKGNPTLRIPAKGIGQLGNIFAAERSLGRAGVTFDTGYGGGYRDWELDWSLKGAALQNPIRHTTKEWYWGSQGPFPTREKALQVMRAVFASGYKGRNPVLAQLPIGATFWRGGRMLQVIGPPKPWGKDVLVPVREVANGKGTLPGFLPTHRSRIMSLLSEKNPRKLTSSMTRPMIRKWIQELTPVQRERVREQVQMRMASHRFMGLPYSEELAKEALRR